MLGWCRVAAARAIGKPTFALFGILTLFVLGVDCANYRVFHAFSKSELSAPSLKAAYDALLRIRPSRVIRFVPVSKETRALAYEVSPTFARLKPELEGKVGQSWEFEGWVNLGIQNELAAGWFVWALRNAADQIGIHETGEKAASFYWEMAREINRACDEKRLPRRTVIFSLLDPGTLTSLEHFPQAQLTWAVEPAAAPLVMINGPVRKELGFWSRQNVFSNVARANSTLGRALQLLLLNIGS
jgi:hypothetical protein